MHDTPAADNVCVLSVVNNFRQDQENALQDIHLSSIMHTQFVLIEKSLDSDLMEVDLFVDEGTEGLQNIDSREQRDGLVFDEFEDSVEEPVGVVLVSFGVGGANFLKNL